MPHPIRAKVVIGLPTRDEASTVERVVHTAVTGLREAGLADCAAMINADNGSTDGTPDLFRASACGVPSVVINSGSERTGKGSDVLAIFHAALDMRAERVLLLDSDVRSGEANW